jgi:hypothetical protein
MREAKACTVGNNQMVGSVWIDVQAHGQFSYLAQQKFFGDYKLTEEDVVM